MAGGDGVPATERDATAAVAMREGSQGVVEGAGADVGDGVMTEAGVAHGYALAERDVAAVRVELGEDAEGDEIAGGKLEMAPAAGAVEQETSRKRPARVQLATVDGRKRKKARGATGHEAAAGDEDTASPQYALRNRDAHMPSLGELLTAVRAYLKDADIETVSVKRLRKDLSKAFGVDLDAHRGFIDKVALDIASKKSHKFKWETAARDEVVASGVALQVEHPVLKRSSCIKYVCMLLSRHDEWQGTTAHERQNFATNGAQRQPSDWLSARASPTQFGAPIA